MSFFTILALLVISNAHEIDGISGAILAGCFAGGIAGAKYTGCFIAAGLFGVLFPFAISTSICRSSATICSGLCFFIGMSSSPLE